MAAVLSREDCYNMLGCEQGYIFFLGTWKNIPLLPAINFHWLPYVNTSELSIVHSDG